LKKCQKGMTLFAVSGNGRKLGNKTREIFQGKRRGIPLLFP